MKPLPVWCAEGTFLSWPGRKWEAPKRTEGLQNRIPREVWRGDELRAEAPFVTQALLVPQGPYGRLPLCILASAHSTPSSTPPHPQSPPRQLPPFPGQDRPREWVMAKVTWTQAHLSWGQFISFFFFFLPSSFFPLSLLKNIHSFVLQSICTPIPLSSFLRHPGHSVKTWQQTAAPYIIQQPPPPHYPSVPMAFFLAGSRLSDVTIALLRCSWPEVDPALRGVLIYPHEGAKRMESWRGTHCNTL